MRLSSTYQKKIPHWYALRATYGRELKAYNYLISNGITAFCPTISVVRENNGKRRLLNRPRLPNIFFAYGTEEQIKLFVYDNVNLPYLRFYYQHWHDGHNNVKEPMIVPEEQIESFRIICEADNANTIISPTSISKFETGQLVRIIDGSFCGVIGRVARYRGQQRVGVIVSGLLTVCTAYIPSAFIELVQ